MAYQASYATDEVSIMTIEMELWDLRTAKEGF